jgi:enterochelin esterase-like enzyme
MRTGQLRAGAAKVDVTPEDLAGLTNLWRTPFEGVHDRIYLRALVVDSGLETAWTMIRRDSLPGWTASPIFRQSATDKSVKERSTSMSNPNTPSFGAPAVQLASPQVLPDKRVTFRIHAPKASEVVLDGDWIPQGLGTGGPFQRDDRGVWSITVGPLPPDFYMYTLTVDGVPTIDPENRAIKQGVNPLKNILFVPGTEAEFEATLAVPHGDVRTVWYESPTLGSARSMRVYTPPDYDTGEKTYPVLYLIHGGGDDDRAWSTIGRAGFILDNLLVVRKAQPMIVVMPNGHVPRQGFTLRLTGADRTDPAVIMARIETISELHDTFVKDLLTTILPFVENRYRVRTDRESRAIAGLSMGGAETLRVAPSHLDLFSHIGVFSMGLQVGAHAGVHPDFEERNAAFFADPERTNSLLKLFWIAAGDNDAIVTDGPRRLSVTITRRGIRHTFNETSGGHTWINWRLYLRDFAQLLFRD